MKAVHINRRIATTSSTKRGVNERVILQYRLILRKTNTSRGRQLVRRLVFTQVTAGSIPVHGTHGESGRVVAGHRKVRSGAGRTRCGGSSRNAARQRQVMAGFGSAGRGSCSGGQMARHLFLRQVIAGSIPVRSTRNRVRLGRLRHGACWSGQG